jgi:hypothetical protein
MSVGILTWSSARFISCLVKAAYVLGHVCDIEVFVLVYNLQIVDIVVDGLILCNVCWAVRLVVDVDLWIWNGPHY